MQLFHSNQLIDTKAYTMKNVNAKSKKAYTALSKTKRPPKQTKLNKDINLDESIIPVESSGIHCNSFFEETELNNPRVLSLSKQASADSIAIGQSPKIIIVQQSPEFNEVESIGTGPLETADYQLA